MQKVKGRYYAYFDDKGRDRKSWPLKTTQKRRAEKELSHLREAYYAGKFDPWNGGWQEPEPVPLKEAEAEFIDSKDTLRERTLDTYRGILRRFREELPPGIMLQDVTADDLAAYIRAPKITNATRRKRYRHLQAFFNWTAENLDLQENPIDGVARPKKEQKEKAFLSPEDVKKLLSTIETHILETRDALGNSPDLGWLYHMIRVAVATGLRRGELVALQWEDVDFESRRLHTRHRGDFRTKGNRERLVPFRGGAEEALVKMRPGPDASGPVFTDRDGEPIRAGRVTTRFKDMARKADLDERIHFHSLRHTTASWLAMKGVPMHLIQEILGHSDQSVTEKYSHLAPETLDAAMEETFAD
jgi:integrase